MSDHITCGDCKHMEPDKGLTASQGQTAGRCALTMGRKPAGQVRGDQWCEKAEVEAGLQPRGRQPGDVQLYQSVVETSS